MMKPDPSPQPSDLFHKNPSSRSSLYNIFSERKPPLLEQF